MTGATDPEGLSAHAAADRRAMMVESQVRPNGVNDRRVLDAMRRLPRERFAPASVRAYADADIPLGHGRFMLTPMLIGRLTQLVMMDNPAHVLVIGAGTGYGAAILADCGADVIALEEDRVLAEAAPGGMVPTSRRAFGPLPRGWPNDGPYEAILIEGAVPAIPASFAAQLAPGGRVIAVLADDPAAGGRGYAGLGRAVLAEPGPRGFAAVPMFDCTARLLPSFGSAAAFAF